jgi:hypothetical protein
MQEDTRPVSFWRVRLLQLGGRQAVTALLALLLGLMLGATSGYRYGKLGADKAGNVALPASQDAAMQKLNAEVHHVRVQLDTADGELAIERSARLALETELRAAQDEVGRVHQQLAFYEQLLPPGPEGSVEIRGATINRQGSSLRYKVLLMRTGKGLFHGMLRFQSNGVLKGKRVSIELETLQLKPEGGEPVVADESTSLLTAQFEHYQRSQGILGLPDGFVPDSVTISLLEGDTVRASRTLKVEL